MKRHFREMNHEATNNQTSTHRYCVVIASHWPAAYAFLRASGRSRASALDITRRFLGETRVNTVVVGNPADSDRRLRKMALSAVGRFLETCRGKRGPEFVSHYAAVPGVLDEHLGEFMYTDGCDTPEEAFGVAWGASIVQHALTQVRDRAIRLGMEPEWVAFERRVARPFLTAQPPSPYPRVRSILPGRHTAQIMLAVATLKRWFAHAINVEVHRTVLRRDNCMTELRTLARLQEKAPVRQRRCPMSAAFFWAMQMTDDPAPALADWLIAEKTGENQRFEDFLSDPKTSLEDLESAKYLFKVLRAEGERTEDRKLGRSAYLATIAAALAHHGKLMSEQSVAALAEAFEQMVDAEDVPEKLQCLAGQGLCQLKTGVGTDEVW